MTKTSPAKSPSHTDDGATASRELVDDTTVRYPSETFADHYGQARTFFRAMSEPEQRHFVSAFACELAKVETLAIRRRMLGHLWLIDEALCAGVEAALGMHGQAAAIDPASWPLDLPASPALSLIAKRPATLRDRRIGALASDGCDGELVTTVRDALAHEGARLEIIAPRASVAGLTTLGGAVLPVDHALSAGPSVLFDAVIIVAPAARVAAFARTPTAIDWVRDAFGHLKVIGYVAQAKPLLKRAGVEPDVGVVEIGAHGGTTTFIQAAKRGRIWARNTGLRSPG